MFWWLYRSPNRVEDPSKPWPIILWLQGGPGASGVGIGNFEEVGPLDTNLKPRNSTWLQKADLLFVAFGLRGTIRDGGILCSCISCNGCRVIPPSQFEIHACKTYRRAAQYICLENGRSLLDLMKVCRNASLHTLEATIQKFINSSPIDKYFTCKNCSVSFPPYCALEDGSLCYSCMESNKPHSPSQESSKNLRALLPASLSMSPKNAKSPKTATPKSARNGILKTPKSTILRPPRGAISKSPKSAMSVSVFEAMTGDFMRPRIDEGLNPIWINFE